MNVFVFAVLRVLAPFGTMIKERARPGTGTDATILHELGTCVVISRRPELIYD